MYKQIARYYDLIHAQLTADLPLIQAIAQQTGGPIVELGCGTGRLVRPLAQAGYQLTGIDNSAEMLTHCRHALTVTEQAQVTLLQGDMLALEEVLAANQGQFALAVIAYNTLMHFSLPQVGQILRQLRPFLQPDGQLFVDITNPFVLAETAVVPQLTLENQLTDPQNGDHILQFAQTHHDENEQICHVNWIFDTSPAAGGAVQRHLSQMTYHYYYPHELELIVQASGYRLRQLWGNYDQTPFTEESERLLLLIGHNNVHMP